MKKLLLVFTVAAFLTACNGTSTQNDAATSDSANVSVPTDSAAVTAPADSATAPLDSAKVNADSTQK